MDATITIKGEITVITFDGRLDANNASQLKSLIKEQEQAGRVKLVLDLGTVNFLDSSGLGAIVAGLRGVGKKGGDMVLCSLSDEVRALFELTRLTKVFDIYDSVDSALKEF